MVQETQLKMYQHSQTERMHSVVLTTSDTDAKQPYTAEHNRMPYVRFILTATDSKCQDKSRKNIKKSNGYSTYSTWSTPFAFFETSPSLTALWTFLSWNASCSEWKVSVLFNEKMRPIRCTALTGGSPPRLKSVGSTTCRHSFHLIAVFAAQDVSTNPPADTHAGVQPRAPNSTLYLTLGTGVAQWLRCCATNRKVAGSIPADVFGIFH